MRLRLWSRDCARGPASLLAVILLSAFPANAQKASPDRVVAEWTLRMGGSLILEGERRPVVDLASLPASDFRIHALNLTGVTLGAYGLRDEFRRLPRLPHLKELYLNGRLWYNQPIAMVADTMAYFSSATELEKLVFSKPAETNIPFDDSILKSLPATALKEARLLQTTITGDSLQDGTPLRNAATVEALPAGDLHHGRGPEEHFRTDRFDGTRSVG
jgi:hypothetical protein